MSYVNRGTVLSTGIVFIVTSITAVGARFAVRLRHDGLKIDDWLCLAALPLVLGACIVMIIGYANHSLGTHSPPEVKPLGESDLVKKLEYCMYMIFVPALCLMKLSTLFFYRRIFRGKAFAISFWILFTFTLLWGVTFFAAFAAACPKVIYFWTSLKAHCADTFHILLLQSILDVIADVGILILPMPFVFRLKMPLRRRIALCCTFAVGALAIACGISRMAIFIETLSVPWLGSPTVAGMRSDDWRGIPGALCIWSILELGVGIVAICLPILRPVLKSRSLESVAHSVRSFVSIRSSGDSTLSSRQKASISPEDGFKSNARSEELPYQGRKGESCASAHFDDNNSDITWVNETSTPDQREKSIMVRRTVELSVVSSHDEGHWQQKE